MMHVWTLAAAVTAAALTGRAPTAALAAPVGPPAVAPFRTTPADADAPVTTSVTEVSVVRETGRAVVVIAVDS
jgi:hypothetical protein